MFVIEIRVNIIFIRKIVLSVIGIEMFWLSIKLNVVNVVNEIVLLIVIGVFVYKLIKIEFNFDIK